MNSKLFISFHKNFVILKKKTLKKWMYELIVVNRVQLFRNINGKNGFFFACELYMRNKIRQI